MATLYKSMMEIFNKQAPSFLEFIHTPPTIIALLDDILEIDISQHSYQDVLRNMLIFVSTSCNYSITVYTKFFEKALNTPMEHHLRTFFSQRSKYSHIPGMFI